MSITFTPTSNNTSEKATKWKMLIRLIRESDAMISRDLSRLLRANRLRISNSTTPIGENAYALSVAVEYETDALVHLSVLPEAYGFFKQELDDVHSFFVKELPNE